MESAGPGRTGIQSERYNRIPKKVKKGAEGAPAPTTAIPRYPAFAKAPAGQANPFGILASGSLQPSPNGYGGQVGMSGAQVAVGGVEIL